MKKELKIEEMTAEELLEYVNKRYADTSNKVNLKIIAEELDTNISRVQTTLNKAGYEYKNRKYVKRVSEQEREEKMEDLDLKYLMLKVFNHSMSARIDETTYMDFLKLCEEKYPSVQVGKLVSLALKEFTEKHK